MDYQLGVVILAAGRSERMGRPKLLLPWKATTVMGHLLEQWTGLNPGQTAVVCAAGDTALEAELQRINFPLGNRVLNPEPHRGMFSSIQCAACWTGWKGNLTHWAIALGDQPHLRRETLRKVLDFSRAQPDRICQPAFQGRQGHPVLLPHRVFRELARSTAANLREFLDEFSSLRGLCEVEDPGLDLDLDFPADYRHAIDLSQD